jgi:hypothetical protein
MGTPAVSIAASIEGQATSIQACMAAVAVNYQMLHRCVGALSQKLSGRSSAATC